MIIPKLHYISQGDSPKALLDNIQKACTSGAELVQLRFKNVSEKKALKIATEAIKITSHFQTRLIIETYYKIAKTIKADGVFLNQTDSCPTKARQHLYPWQIIGGAANMLEDCKVLLTKDVDYISLGPYNLTSDSLDLNRYSTIIKTLTTNTPILAFGDINTEDIKPLLNTGVSGVAVYEVITKNFDSIKTFNTLLKASVVEERRHTFE